MRAPQAPTGTANPRLSAVSLATPLRVSIAPPERAVQGSVKSPERRCSATAGAVVPSLSATEGVQDRDGAGPPRSGRESAPGACGRPQSPTCRLRGKPDFSPSPLIWQRIAAMPDFGADFSLVLFEDDFSDAAGDRPPGTGRKIREAPEMAKSTDRPFSVTNGRSPSHVGVRRHLPAR
jgi:hypothetical protein